MNTHESYVSLETAKMLKEAGFDWNCYATYNLQDGNFDFRCCADNWNAKLSRYASAPTLAVAQRWLREVKGMWLTVETDHIAVSNIPFWVIKNPFLSGSASTYEETLETGIQHCLKFLLEESV